MTCWDVCEAPLLALRPPSQLLLPLHFQVQRRAIGSCPSPPSPLMPPPLALPTSPSPIAALPIGPRGSMVMAAATTFAFSPSRARTRPTTPRGTPSAQPHPEPLGYVDVALIVSNIWGSGIIFSDCLDVVRAPHFQEPLGHLKMTLTASDDHRSIPTINIPCPDVISSARFEEPLSHVEMTFLASLQHHWIVAVDTHDPDIVSGAHLDEPLSRVDVPFLASYHHRSSPSLLLVRVLSAAPISKSH